MPGRLLWARCCAPGTSLVLGFPFADGETLVGYANHGDQRAALAQIPDFDGPADEVVRRPGSFQQGYASVPIVF